MRVKYAGKGISFAGSCVVGVNSYLQLSEERRSNTGAHVGQNGMRTFCRTKSYVHAIMAELTQPKNYTPYRMLVLGLLSTAVLSMTTYGHYCNSSPSTSINPQDVECISRESNPELGHGKTQCYRYTTDALKVRLTHWLLRTSS